MLLFLAVELYNFHHIYNGCQQKSLIASKIRTEVLKSKKEEMKDFKTDPSHFE